MGEDEREGVQLRFEDGRLVERSDPSDPRDGDLAADPIEPGQGDGFVLEAKPGALEANDRLRSAVETHGHTLEFGSRRHAEAYASQLSASDGSLRVQAAPENEPRDVDAYLLGDHDPSIEEPAETDGETWTFDVGANLYGALGEAILLESPKPHAVVHFVRQDLDVEEADLDRGVTVDVTRGRPLSVEGATGAERWTPDCVVGVRDGWDGERLERYYCEIKTGGASFERSQTDVMEAVAADERVLKIRVGIEALPDQYSVRITEVEPSA